MQTIQFVSLNKVLLLELTEIKYIVLLSDCLVQMDPMDKVGNSYTLCNNVLLAQAKLILRIEWKKKTSAAFITCEGTD